MIASLIKKGILLRNKMSRKKDLPEKVQREVLKKLLKKAKATSFGKDHGFSEILQAEDIENAYKKRVSLCDYEGMQSYWQRVRADEANVTWPGKVKYFALSSGTSGSSSKHIPTSKQMLKAVKKISLQQAFTLPQYDLGDEIYTKQFLSLGGSTNLVRENAHYNGDISGINGRTIPPWIRPFFKPRKQLSDIRDWPTKLEAMVKEAGNWDIGIIGGVPAWAQIFIEKVIEHYEVDTIHDVWPSFQVFIHAGVSITPYVSLLNKHFGRKVHFIEAYAASEGFIAAQMRPNTSHLQLMLGYGIYYEFIPFHDAFFDTEGQLKDPNCETVSVEEVELGVPYAIAMSTCAGAWRYMVGDVIKFVSLEPLELIVTGRTKHFLSLVGEHLSADNMIQALHNTAEHFGVSIPEFTVMGIPYDGLFAHHWYVGCDEPCNEEAVKEYLDAELRRLNDDYSTERDSALKAVFLTVLPIHTFEYFLKYLGKTGSQIKFPRVLKGKRAEEWRAFVKQ